MKTIDEQLEDALARLKQLETDAMASASLLTEAGLQHERYRQEIAVLTKERETLVLTNTELTEQRDQLSRDLTTAKQSLASAASNAEELAKATDQIVALAKEVEMLKANAKSAERIAAERYGAATPEPLPVTPRGDSEAASLLEKFKAVTDPTAQTAFWRSLTAAQRTLILNAQ